MLGPCDDISLRGCTLSFSSSSQALHLCSPHVCLSLSFFFCFSFFCCCCCCCLIPSPSPCDLLPSSRIPTAHLPVETQRPRNPIPPASTCRRHRLRLHERSTLEREIGSRVDKRRECTYIGHRQSIAISLELRCISPLARHCITVITVVSTPPSFRGDTCEAPCKSCTTL